MHTADAPWMARLLGVAAPWVVSDVHLSVRTRVATVRVEQPPPRSGLFGRRAAPAPRRQCTWDHVGLAGWRCRVTLVLRDGQAVPQASWTGDDPQGWTRGLQRLVMDLLLAGATVEQLAVLTGLPFAELWKWKFRLDQGSPRLAAPPPAQAPPPASVAPAAAGLVVPTEGSPVWPALLHRRLALDVRTLGLRLLLSKLRSQIRRIDDDEVRMVKLVELHRYFARHQATLGHEIDQIRAWQPH